MSLFQWVPPPGADPIVSAFIEHETRPLLNLFTHFYYVGLDADE